MSRCPDCRPLSGPSAATLTALVLAMLAVMAALFVGRIETADCVAAHPTVAEVQASIEACKADQACRVTSTDIRLIRSLKDQAREQCRR